MLCGVGSGTHQTSGCLVCDPPPPVLLYYVKFHKVGGTSLSLLLTELLVNNLRQWTSLSQPRFVAGPAKAAECEDGACIGHQSLQYWKMLSYDHQNPESLLSTMQRHAELREVQRGRGEQPRRPARVDLLVSIITLRSYSEFFSDRRLSCVAARGDRARLVHF